MVVNTLVLNGAGNILIGTNAGMYRLKNGKISQYKNNFISINTQIKIIKVFKKKKLWIGTKKQDYIKYLISVLRNFFRVRKKTNYL